MTTPSDGDAQRGEEAEPRVRATLRCLLEDLRAEVEGDALRLALRSARAELAADALYQFPVLLSEISHPVVTKANVIASDSNADRTRIEAIGDEHVVRVKTGPRRGALWKDPDGQWWLLAAGRRQDDGAGDFYQQMKAYSNDSSPIRPTQRDYSYMRLERAIREDLREEREAHQDVLRALLDAARDPRTTQEIEVFGARVTVRVVPDDDGIAVIEVTWAMASYEQLDRFPADVLAMIPAGDSVEDWTNQPPPPGTDMEQMWWTYAPQRWVDDLAVAAELDDLIPPEPEWTPPGPVSDGSERFSHWAKGTAVTRAYIEGIEIVGMCGARIVAHRDYETLPVCTECERAVELLRALRRGGNDA